MKAISFSYRFFYSFVFILLGMLACQAEPTQSDNNSLKLAPGVFISIQESEYEIRWQNRVSAYQSPNRANNLRFTYLQNGFWIEKRAQKELCDHWKIMFILTSVGSENAPFHPAANALDVIKNTARASSDHFTVEYMNSEEGMRQTFLVNLKPAQGQLQIVMNLIMNGVDCVKAQKGNYVYFTSSDGKEVMRYTDLNAWDSTGAVLKANMELSANNELILLIDDSNAQYPVTVDPLSMSPPEVVRGDQGGCRFGFSVASVGKVCESSHYGGVIVGAPFYDNGEPDEGKVFVYYGDYDGLPAVADWTAESDQAYARFGYCVAATDYMQWNPTTCTFNSDYIDDVIIGAPNYSTPGFSHNGCVFVWYSSLNGLGDPGTPDNADFQFGGEQNDSGFGYSVACAGDVDNNNNLDLVIGSIYYAEENRIYQGAVYVFQALQGGLYPSRIG